MTLKVRTSAANGTFNSDNVAAVRTADSGQTFECTAGGLKV